jgi:hypothetical protein
MSDSALISNSSYDDPDNRFPVKLFTILEVEDNSIISWCADGSSIKIHNDDRLSSSILPKYFQSKQLFV